MVLLGIIAAVFISHIVPILHYVCPFSILWGFIQCPVEVENWMTCPANPFLQRVTCILTFHFIDVTVIAFQIYVFYKIQFKFFLREETFKEMEWLTLFSAIVWLGWTIFEYAMVWHLNFLPSDQFIFW